MEIDVNSRWDNGLDSVIVVSGVLGSELESIVPESYSAGLSGSLQDGRQFIRGEEPGWSILLSVWLVEVIQPHSPKAVGTGVFSTSLAVDFGHALSWDASILSIGGLGMRF